VFGGPEDHFGEDGSEIEALGRQNVDQLAAIGRIFLGSDDAVSNQFFQAVREDVGGDSFVGSEEFLEGAEAAQHHVAKDQEGPAVAEHFDGGVEGASGAAIGNGPFRGHRGMVAIITCNKQVRLADWPFASL
jgi:hypothetical protein